MPLRIDRVDSEIEILRKESEGEESAGATASAWQGGLSETLSSRRGRSELLEQLRPLVMEILNDELMRIKRKVGPA